MPGTGSTAPVQAVRAQAYVIPTDSPEADGTMQWTSTTLIVVEVDGGGCMGLGYTYTDAAAAPLIRGMLAEVVKGQDALDIPAAWQAMQRRVRNVGRQGLAATAISAMDAALWDLKARLLGLPLALLLGRAREAVPIYGSGGFTTYSDAQLRDQLAGWVERDGCQWVKMKISTHPGQDPHRLAVARKAIGDHGLFVDSNGALSTKQALATADILARDFGVLWYEEPVSSDDLEGLRLLRQRAPATLEIVAGEYGYEIDYFRRMLNAGAVDVQQADASRCGGITGFLRAAVLCDAHHVDLSGHCAPTLHLHAACAAPHFRHLEWFHDHVRIEQMLFDGAPVAQEGMIRPDLSRPGLGIAFRRQDAERYAA
ncbi:enolase C-terminal domain-like protein [Roseomonas sp. E05]|uniref:enolase C-terminal domain-like protein n=1 Tax=Roseomonas sp. E05 TaxID=3046310 RepID=UPI0024BA7DF9|nr:enolase C-terminal domain-like protein [Roseomonas sp. E05]MDJ0386928.1 enolase C-terminal domain-like protein [Roseomonas sp. E05]